MLKKKLKLVLIMIIVAIVGLIGFGIYVDHYCANYSLKSNTVMVKQGEEINQDVSIYVTGNNKVLEETILDFSNVNTMKKGYYEVNTSYRGHTLSFYIYVTDKTDSDIKWNNEILRSWMEQKKLLYKIYLSIPVGIIACFIIYLISQIIEMVGMPTDIYDRYNYDQRLAVILILFGTVGISVVVALIHFWKYMLSPSGILIAIFLGIEIKGLYHLLVFAFDKTIPHMGKCKKYKRGVGCKSSPQEL